MAVLLHKQHSHCIVSTAEHTDAQTVRNTREVLNNYLDTDKAAIPVWGLISIFITITTTLNRNTKKTT